MENSKLTLLEEENKQLFDLLITNADVNKLPETLFVENFLPFFCGEREIGDNKDFLPYWISIAGSPTAEVQIIDGAGYELYRVPPIADTTIIEPAKRKGNVNFGEIVALTKLHSNVTPAKGENYLNKQLADKFFKLTSQSTIFSENEKRWISIFERYGKLKVDDTALANKKAAEVLRDDEFEF